MGFWDLFKKPAPEPASRAESAKAPPKRAANLASVTASEEGAPKELSRLLQLGLDGGPGEAEALSAWRTLRSTPDEARAVEELVRISRLRKLPDFLLLELGVALLDRGESDAATRVLSGATSSPALVLLADLAERRRDLPSAVSYIERVLLRDLDHPGARERHRRWRAELGDNLEHKPLTAGATILTREPDSPFELLREVGRGGAAVVYQARDRELGRHVALKVYHRPDRDREQLLHEGRVAVQLEGPGIVRVFDVDPTRGWIALEWAPEGALRGLIRERDRERLLPIDRWALTLASALARVHAAGWVHHDVKPANVVLTRKLTAILTDFGTARRAGEPSPPGSLGYISPERIQGRPSHPRDDIYGFGRVLEDALEVIGESPSVSFYRALAAACIGPSEQRPADGLELVRQLQKSDVPSP